MGMMAVVSKTVNANIGVTAATMAGFNLATKLATISMTSWMAAAGWMIVALPALTSLFFRHTITLDELNATNEKTADGFVKVDKAISGAQLSMAAYNSAMVDYNENQLKAQKLEAINQYHKRKGDAGSWSQFWDELPYWNVKDNMKVPEKQDFGINPSNSASNNNMVITIHNDSTNKVTATNKKNGDVINIDRKTTGTFPK
jgi:hypothetical protein